MNTELQNKVWSILPKEFKEEVKRLWQSADKEQQLPHDAFLRGEYSMLVSLFGIHNLTSDAEGEEMLTCDRDVVRMLYDRTDSVKVRKVLESIFGSKCLPDELNEDNFATKKPKPAEPKFKKWDKVLVKADTAISKDMEIYKKLPSEIKRIDGETALIGMLPNVMICDMQVRLGNLEPYTEPKNEGTHQEQCVPKNAESGTHSFSHILKDGFHDNDRLHIAAQITASIYSNKKTASRFDSIEALVRKALDITDTLIAEAERTDKLNK